MNFSPGASGLGRRGGPCARTCGGGLRVCDVRDEPVVHFPEHVEDGFTPLVAVGFERQEHEAHRGSLAL